jgi:hypothetical protein
MHTGLINELLEKINFFFEIEGFSKSRLLEYKKGLRRNTLCCNAIYILYDSIRKSFNGKIYLIIFDAVYVGF